MSKSVRKRGSIFHVKHPNWACEAHTHTHITNPDLSIIPYVPVHNWKNHHIVYSNVINVIK